MKTIINCWCQNAYDPRENGLCSPGLGDMIMGSICLYQLCKKHNYNYIIDNHLHPISKCLKNNKTEYSDYLDTIKDNIPFFNHFTGVEDFIVNSKNDIVVLYTNEFFSEEITDDAKNFIKNILEPNDNIKNEINKLVNDLPLDYSIIHMRLGDEIFFSDKIPDKIYYDNCEKYIDMVNSIINQNSIILSDSYYFKKYANEKLSIPYIDLKGGHIGCHNDEELIKNAFIEFYIATKSKKITSHTIYGWKSGFVTMAARCYNIPIDYI